MKIRANPWPNKPLPVGTRGDRPLFSTTDFTDYGRETTLGTDPKGLSINLHEVARISSTFNRFVLFVSIRGQPAPGDRPPPHSVPLREIRGQAPPRLFRREFSFLFFAFRRVRSAARGRAGSRNTRSGSSHRPRTSSTDANDARASERTARTTSCRASAKPFLCEWENLHFLRFQRHFARQKRSCRRDCF